jgi:hypothetical protein
MVKDDALNTIGFVMKGKLIGTKSYKNTIVYNCHILRNNFKLHLVAM